AGPNRQVQLGFSSGIPGVTSLNLSVTIGEPPQGTSWITFGGEGAEVYTAQTRIRATAGVGPLTVAGVSVSLQVPMAIDIASGKARLARISCGSDPARDAAVTLAARPAVGGFYLGQPDDPDGWTRFKPVGIQSAQVVSVAKL